MRWTERDRLIFIAFVVISVTLLLQGLTLPWLVRRLNVSASDDDRNDAEQELLRRARDAGFQRLDELSEQENADGDVIEQARENPDRMWHSLGYAPNGLDDDPRRRAAGRAGDAVTVNAIKDEMLAAVLRRPDSRGTHPE